MKLPSANVAGFGRLVRYRCERVKSSPVRLEPASQLALVGVYGVNRISVVGDTLRFQRRQRAPRDLVALGKGRFMVRGQSDFRVRFERDGEGRGQRLLIEWGGGQVEVSARE